MSSRKFVLSSLIPALLLFAWGFYLCFLYGRIGIHPLDMGIVWDGGWRILCGQLPYRDFVAPSAVVPAFMQALLFKMLGVGWNSYLVHASLLNGAFAVIAWALAGRLGCGRLLSFVAGFGSAVVFYAPFGTPFYDQHGYFFCLAVFWLQVIGQTSSVPWQNRAAALLWGPCLFLALFSKQVPTVFLIAWLPLLWMLRIPKDPKTLLAWAAGGFLGTAFLIFVLSAWAGVSLSLFLYYYLRLPLSTGEGRAGTDLSSFQVLHYLKWLHSWFPFLLVSLTTWAVTGIYLAKKKVRAAWNSFRDTVFPVSVGLALGAGSFSSLLLTNNEAANSVPFAFLAGSLFTAGFLKSMEGVRNVIHPHRLRTFVTCIRWILIFLISLFAVLKGREFNQKTNRGRSVHSLANLTKNPLPPASPGVLSPLVWLVQPSIDPGQEPFMESVAWLKESPDAFVVANDWTFLYALSGKEPPMPVLWFHSGLTVPLPSSEAYGHFQNWMLKQLVDRKVKWMVVDPLNHECLSIFPVFQKWYEANRSRSQKIGAFEMVPISPTLDGQP